MTYTQTNRRIAITTPLGEDKLLLRGFSGTEAISQLFYFNLDLLSESDSVGFHDIVGKDVSLSILSAEGEDRYWHGVISRFSQGHQDGKLTAYHAQMVPWLWFLTRTSNCRIFQNQKVPDIIQNVFKAHKFSDFELRLHGDFAPRDYCVQYRESDFNFVSRLMEEEGIYYFFKQDKSKHVMVLANDPAAHQANPQQKTARLASVDAAPYEDVVTEWHYHEEFRTGQWAQTDYNFETPSTNLAVSVNGKNPYEIYDYPGEYRVRSDGDRLAKIRLQEHATPVAVSQGTSGCRHFASGFKFTLQDHYRKDLNQDYLLTSVSHKGTQGGSYPVGEQSEEDSYSNTFQCIPFSTPFRPQRTTPQPVVQGCQTAVVVGPGGEEIYTDKHGRVKVQFHWDREGKKNENSSCWVRVSHPWAGKGWGSISIPRIGQEVIVDFLEGDPDQPIIVGRVYNAEQTPPFGMPGGAMISGIISNSTKGGGGSNEISMNDTKGKEMVKVHAQYDMDTTVEHDDTQTVVSGDRTITVKTGKHTETIKGDTAITIQTGNHSLTVQTGTHAHTVKGAVTETYQANQATTVDNEIVITSKASHIAGQAATYIELQVGASKLRMDCAGNIEMKGVNITINGAAMVTTKGGIVHSEADAEHQTKGAIIISDGSATNTIKGGMVMLNP
jgi:type VI secretion system secreted protein VgrG